MSSGFSEITEGMKEEKNISGRLREMTGLEG